MSWSQRIRKAIGPMLDRKLIIRRTMASAVLLLLAFGSTACTRDFTVAYLYVTASDGPNVAGYINEYSIDYQTGVLVRIRPAIKAGANPVALVTTSNGLFVYVVNQGDSTVEEFAVSASDGTLTSKNKYPTGNTPTAMAIDAAGKFLYVTFRFQPGYSAVKPGPGGINIFPISADNSLGTASTVNIGNNPVGVVVSRFNNLVYVIDQENPGTASASGVILGFTQNPSSGALTPVPGTTITTGQDGKTVATGFGAGVRPSAIAIDPTSRFVYVTDQQTNQLFGNIVQNTGQLIAMLSSPSSTGNLPVSVTIDPRGMYLYVANYNSSTVSPFAINQSSGAVTASVGTSIGGGTVGTGPSCVAIEPALGIYLYTANALDDSVSGQKLDPHNGALQPIQNTPFPATGAPSCAAGVANGAHAVAVVNP